MISFFNAVGMEKIRVHFFVGNHAEFASFENFYREAAARDGAMATNILQAINEATQPGANPDPVEGGPVVLLVTGEYHAEGITSQLTQQGMTVISFVPKIEKWRPIRGRRISVCSPKRELLWKNCLRGKSYSSHLTQWPVGKKRLWWSPPLTGLKIQRRLASPGKKKTDWKVI